MFAHNFISVELNRKESNILMEDKAKLNLLDSLSSLSAMLTLASQIRLDTCV
jgi:hypothetical protein